MKTKPNMITFRTYHLVLDERFSCMKGFQGYSTQVFDPKFARRFFRIFEESTVNSPNY